MAVDCSEILRKVPEKYSVVIYSVCIVTITFFPLFPKILNYPTFSVAVSNISRSYPELQFLLNSHFIKLISQQWLWDFQKKRRL